VSTGRVYVSHVVVFNENVFSFFPTSSQCRFPTTHQNPTPSSLRNSHEDVLVDDHRANGANLGSESHDVQGEEITAPNGSQSGEKSSVAQQQTNHAPNDFVDPARADDPSVSASESPPSYQLGSASEHVPASPAATVSAAIPSQLAMSPNPVSGYAPTWDSVAGSAVSRGGGIRRLICCCDQRR
jgi:hypothetical protein